MAEISRIASSMRVQETLAQAQAYQEMLTREAAAKAAIEEQHAAQEAAIGAQIGAVVEAAYLVASADGRYTSAEADRLVERVAALTDNKFSTDQISAMAEQARERCEAEGASARTAAIAELLPDAELRSATLLVASCVGWLDGGVGQKEGLALQSLARAFGVSIDELHKIMGQAAH